MEEWIITKRIIACLSIGLFALGITVGCSTGSSTPKASSVVTKTDNAHPEEGPHGGELLELGDEIYHAEFVHDEAKKIVEIYLLDSTGKKSISIPDDSVTIMVRLDGKNSEFKLQADRAKEMKEADRFHSSDPELLKLIDNQDAKARFQVSIAGMSYSGPIQTHSHSH